MRLLPPSWMAAVLLWTSLVAAGCGGSASQKPTYVDPAPHEAGFVTLESGVQLHYLDFGGSGDVLLLLAGAGNSAHIYDEFAPLLTDDFHVIALTRRGYGESSQPDSGYDTQTLANDIGEFLSVLDISQANVAGHSIAGAEMTRFAIDNPERVLALVYLDAAYDWAESTASSNPENQPEVPAPSSSQLASPSAFAAYVAWVSGVASYPEADVRATNRFRADGEYEGPVTSAEISAALATGAAEEHPGYADVAAPILAFYTVPDSVTDMFPWLAVDSPEFAKAEGVFASVASSLAEQREAFAAAVPEAMVIELHSVPHFLFLDLRDELVDSIREFLR